MEFFTESVNPALDADHIRELVQIGNMPSLCQSVSEVLENRNDEGRIYCTWGEFAVNREEIRHGVRFTLPGCPNALAWSITCEEADGKTVIHCTINRQQHDTDFIESIQEFISDWRIGLNSYASHETEQQQCA